MLEVSTNCIFSLLSCNVAWSTFRLCTHGNWWSWLIPFCILLWQLTIDYKIMKRHPSTIYIYFSKWTTYFTGAASTGICYLVLLPPPLLPSLSLSLHLCKCVCVLWHLTRLFNWNIMLLHDYYVYKSRPLHFNCWIFYLINSLINTNSDEYNCCLIYQCKMAFTCLFKNNNFNGEWYLSFCANWNEQVR